MTKILVTGSEGFIAKNLITFLKEKKNTEIITFDKRNNLDELKKNIFHSDLIFHLAGENRSEDKTAFKRNNADLTEKICEFIVDSKRNVPILYSSSVKVIERSHYGKSKKKAEDILLKFSKKYSNPITIYRLPNVFGKWCKPNYNSVVATFCSNIIDGKQLEVHDPKSKLTLVYIDDLIKEFSNFIQSHDYFGFKEISNTYTTSLEDIVKKLEFYKASRKNLIVERVGTGFDRALYSTFISYLKPKNFSYNLKINEDHRGIFGEFLKTKDSGQFSFFTVNPKKIRGGHYHHTKNEKFLILKGKAEFRFRNLKDGKKYSLKIDSNKKRVVETVPGWSHDIKNIGTEELIVMIWANEIFDEKEPDTYQFEI